ncbi:unnamed protein product [Protopolystoma xenopodis]|uniref:Uncharacterized protein n=1 Tax=Protopolystoma xenopodis TaxID=117903 RepID=A0A3S5CJL4_9PLAT|nr:unnamed protein product [Protopolystoma xenopodis]
MVAIASVVGTNKDNSSQLVLYYSRSAPMGGKKPLWPICSWSSSQQNLVFLFTRVRMNLRLSSGPDEIKDVVSKCIVSPVPGL